MPLDPSIHKVLIIGSGPITIGQGCEFDYSGSQACKALKEEGCTVILINSNPATIMTDTDTADKVYIEPITIEFIEKIILKEKPDSLLPIVGGQTALNCTTQLNRRGLLTKYRINLIGVTLDAIEKAESRKKFREEMLKIGVKVPNSFSVSSREEVQPHLQTLQFPLVIRSSFTLGGQGGGIAYNISELEQICKHSLSFSSEVLIEESLIGWKEFELEVMRDRKGNSIVVCGIENIDPMGVHTGDSITTSPIQTLSDKEYQLMRKRAFQVLEAIGMTSGGCNVQFAVNPKTGRMLCIEINPRVSRSSALASKATGFPIAKIATKIAIGYNLDELKIAESSFPSAFEPTLDYVVVKMPRFTFEKFPQANPYLTTSMKSVGEVMAIGRSFQEALNKALSSIDISLDGPPQNQLERPHYNRFWNILEAFKVNISIEEVHSLTHYDRWFLAHIAELAKEETKISETTLETISSEQLHHWKKMGFSDERLATLLKCKQDQVTERRDQFNIHPIYKRIDTCSAEFPNSITCMYSTYEEECESIPTNHKKVVILGSGPNRIGQGIEFDYCCVHAAKAAKDLGYETIMINCNPATVSTDYDVTDRLYFEPLTLEHIREILDKEQPCGTIIQMGGQTALNIGKLLSEEGFSLPGTSMETLELAEDRSKFRLFAEQIGLCQPQNDSFNTAEEAMEKSEILGFPIIVRPSYIIGGKSIKIITNKEELKQYLQEIHLEAAAPILMEELLKEAIEVEVDAICDGNSVFICGIIEHLEPAGIHSGDSISSLSPYRLKSEIQEELIEQTIKIGLSLNVIGLFNVQFAIKNDTVFVLEVNPRASRTIPLLCKTTGLPLVQIATKCILGYPLNDQLAGRIAEPQFLGLKIPVFPFSRLQLKNEPLGPQMKSTGEVLCTGKTFDELFLKAKKYASQIESKNLQN